jgi:hypothetical protein
MIFLIVPAGCLECLKFRELALESIPNAFAYLDSRRAESVHCDCGHGLLETRNVTFYIDALAAVAKAGGKGSLRL